MPLSFYTNMRQQCIYSTSVNSLEPLCALSYYWIIIILYYKKKIKKQTIYLIDVCIALESLCAKFDVSTSSIMK